MDVGVILLDSVEPGGSVVQAASEKGESDDPGAFKVFLLKWGKGEGFGGGLVAEDFSGTVRWKGAADGFAVRTVDLQGVELLGV